MENDDQGGPILITLWPLTGTSLIFLILRVICKFKTRRGLWWDDYVMIMAWLALLISVIFATLGVLQGEGRHLWLVPPQNLAYVGLMGNLTGTFSILGAVWSKTAFALMLLRLMSGRWRALLWVIIVSMNVAMTLNAVFLWTRCMPLAKTWNPTMEGVCWAPHVYPIYGLFAAGYSAAADFVLSALPWKIVWNLQMKKREKFGVAAAMSLGAVAGATAVVKTIKIPTLQSGDFTYDSTPLVVWGAVESAVTIMAASIPVLRVLFRNGNPLSRLQAAAANHDDSRGAIRSIRVHKSVVVLSVDRTQMSDSSADISRVIRCYSKV